MEFNFKTREIIDILGEYKHNIKMEKRWIAEVESTNTVNMEVNIIKHKNYLIVLQKRKALSKIPFFRLYS